MHDNDESVLSAMVRRTISDCHGLDRSQDFEMVGMVMGPARKAGFDIGDLKPFRDGRFDVYGVERGREHRCGVTRFEGDMVDTAWRSYAIFARSTGIFAGQWVFVLTLDLAVGTNHDGQPVEEYLGLEGTELIEAVVTSALTEPALAPRRGWGLRRR